MKVGSLTVFVIIILIPMLLGFVFVAYMDKTLLDLERESCDKMHESIDKYYPNTSSPLDERWEDCVYGSLFLSSKYSEDLDVIYITFSLIVISLAFSLKIDNLSKH